MDKLQDARMKINEIDREMASLFEQRMLAAKEIAEYKKDRGLQIYDPKREQTVIEKNAAYIKDYDIRSAEGNATVVRSMSGGNQQKAIVGREIEQDGKVLIFVQPTRGLDIGAIEKIHSQIIAQRDRGKAILLISLELDEVMELADTIAVIYNGELGKTAPAASFTTKEMGEYMMGVRRDEKK